MAQFCHPTNLRPAYRKKLNYQIPLMKIYSFGNFRYCLLLFAQKAIFGPLVVRLRLLFIIIFLTFFCKVAVIYSANIIYCDPCRHCDQGRSNLQCKHNLLRPGSTLRPRSQSSTVQTQTTATLVDTATKVA